MREPRGRMLGRMRARVVDDLVMHGAPVDFRTLCLRAVPGDARTLLLDLDRTVHLHRNMGELLGWEIGAERAYGHEVADALAALRGPGRFVLDTAHPGRLLRYLALGARTWARPGLYYLFWGKLAGASSVVSRWSFRALGPDALRAAQWVPQLALMHMMAERPLGELRELAGRAWRRHEADQVVLREDLAWLRRRRPSLRIVLTSASPQPVLEVAGERLDVDDVIYSGIEERDGWLSAPAFRHAVTEPARAPRRIAPLSGLRVNTGEAKIDEVAHRYPGALGPGASTVGITDTGYGEDHCWARHLSTVVDVNSTAPFPPIVASESPLRAVHSAAALTRAERQARSTGSSWLDPRRSAVDVAGPLHLTRSTLEAELGTYVVHASRLLDAVDEAHVTCAAVASPARSALRAVEERISSAVSEYNDHEGPRHEAALRALDELSAEHARARRALARAVRPVSRATRELESVLTRARARASDLAGRAPAQRARTGARAPC